LKETAEVIAKVGFKMFLGVTAQVVGYDAVRTLKNMLRVSIACAL
jgi:hypothetical protein